jgi:hypothetical protein
VICESCGREFSEDWRKDAHLIKVQPVPRFCSKGCAHRRVQTEEMNRARSQKVRKTRIDKFCIDCGVLLAIWSCKNPKKIRCVRCQAKQPRSDSYKNKLRQKALERVADGTHQGWTKRPFLSYAEQCVKYILNAKGLEGKYSINYAIKKSDLGINEKACYFLDFYFPECKLDLEIDGKQHTWIINMQKDLVRDDLLRKGGFFVRRISWHGNKTKEQQEVLLHKIEEILSEFDIR